VLGHFRARSWLVIRRSSRGAHWGARCRQRWLARAGQRWREPVFSLVRPYTAVTGLADCVHGKEKVYGSISVRGLQAMGLFRMGILVPHLRKVPLEWHP